MSVAMELPCPTSFRAPAARAPAELQRPWSFTTSTPARDAQDALVVCRVPLATLGIDDLIEEVTERCGEEEGRRWQYARAEEYATSLANALRMYIASAELIVHVDEDAGDERVQVLLTPTGDPADATRREIEVVDRVQAIRKRTWLTWWQDTVGCLRNLEAAF